MEPLKEPRRFEPVWWTVQHTVVWEQHRPLLRNEYDRRRTQRHRAELTKQGPDDAVIQHHPTSPRNIDVGRAHLVMDNDWEVGTDWEEIEPGLRYGVGARLQYPDYAGWNDELEARLREEWQKKHKPTTWEKVKRAVRHGFEYKNKDVS